MPRETADSAPLISIITVTFNAVETLGRTLDSVRSQSFSDFEHLIIDGASTDHTIDLARRGDVSRQRIFSEPDRGLYDAMNKGLAKAQGEYVVFLNAGDTFHSADTLQKVADAIKAYDFPGVVYGQTDIVDNDGKRLAERHLTAPRNLTYRSMASGMVVCHQAFFALRRIVESYDLRYRFSADYEWVIRVLQHSRANIYIDDVLADYLMEGMTTRNRRRSLAERFRIMAHYFGLLPTVGRHIAFIPRFLRRQKLEKTL